VYSVKCNKYYVGHTDNLERRLTEHNAGKGGQFTSKCFPWKLGYTEKYELRSVAVNRELEIKRKKRRSYIE
jgi:putative endonuclease